MNDKIKKYVKERNRACFNLYSFSIKIFPYRGVHTGGVRWVCGRPGSI